MVGNEQGAREIAEEVFCVFVQDHKHVSALLAIVKHLSQCEDSQKHTEDLFVRSSERAKSKEAKALAQELLLAFVAHLNNEHVQTAAVNIIHTLILSGNRDYETMLLEYAQSENREARTVALKTFQQGMSSHQAIYEPLLLKCAQLDNDYAKKLVVEVIQKGLREETGHYKSIFIACLESENKHAQKSMQKILLALLQLRLQATQNYIESLLFECAMSESSFAARAATVNVIVNFTKNNNPIAQAFATTVIRTFINGPDPKALEVAKNVLLACIKTKNPTSQMLAKTILLDNLCNKRKLIEEILLICLAYPDRDAQSAAVQVIVLAETVVNSQKSFPNKDFVPSFIKRCIQKQDPRINAFLIRLILQEEIPSSFRPTPKEILTLCIASDALKLAVDAMHACIHKGDFLIRTTAQFASRTDEATQQFVIAITEKLACSELPKENEIAKNLLTLHITPGSELSRKIIEKLFDSTDPAAKTLLSDLLLTYIFDNRPEVQEFARFVMSKYIASECSKEITKALEEMKDKSSRERLLSFLITVIMKHGEETGCLTKSMLHEYTKTAFHEVSKELLIRLMQNEKESLQQIAKNLLIEFAKDNEEENPLTALSAIQVVKEKNPNLAARFLFELANTKEVKHFAIPIIRAGLLAKEENLFASLHGAQYAKAIHIVTEVLSSLSTDEQNKVVPFIISQCSQKSLPILFGVLGINGIKAPHWAAENPINEKLSAQIGEILIQIIALPETKQTLFGKSLRKKGDKLKKELAKIYRSISEQTPPPLYSEKCTPPSPLH